MLRPGDPLAHRAVDPLLRVDPGVRRRLGADLEREGVSRPGFSVLVLLALAGGELRLRTIRERLRAAKADATEVVGTLCARALVVRSRSRHDPRTAVVTLTALGQELVDRLLPEYSEGMPDAFSALDAEEERTLAALRRTLAA